MSNYQRYKESIIYDTGKNRRTNRTVVCSEYSPMNVNINQSYSSNKLKPLVSKKKFADPKYLTSSKANSEG